MSVTEPEVETTYGGESDTDTAEDTTVTQSNIGLFMDYYFNPEGGFHLQGLVGIGILSVEVDDPDVESTEASGPMVALGLGYEGWIGEQWGLGVLGRLTAASLKSDEVSGQEVKTTHTVVTPAILATITCH